MDDEDDDIRKATEKAAQNARADQSDDWKAPDMGIINLRRRAPPDFPKERLGEWWGNWVAKAAEASAAPVDYVAMPLLACASVLIGNARWAQATPSWSEPPHLWIATVGDSGHGKSPGSDLFLKTIMPRLRLEMRREFPDQLREWQAAQQLYKATERKWQREAKKALDGGNDPPSPPNKPETSRPEEAQLVISDITIERLATLLATVAPKGLLIHRDELSGWVQGLNNYNDSGRAFYTQAYDGRPYSVERQTREPIYVVRLVVAFFGTTQPDKVPRMIQGADDGLFGRFCWAWPNSVEFELYQAPVPTLDVLNAFERLRALKLGVDQYDSEAPVMVRLCPAGADFMNDFGKYTQYRGGKSGGLLRSAWGKARGHALRLALILDYLDWARSNEAKPPVEISETRFIDAMMLMLDYFLPMAERVYSDAAASQTERNAATLARWIMDKHPTEIYVREMIRTIRLPGIRDSKTIHQACEFLVEADWLRLPAPGDFQQRRREAYPVNPRIWL